MSNGRFYYVLLITVLISTLIPYVLIMLLFLQISVICYVVWISVIGVAPPSTSLSRPKKSWMSWICLCTLFMISVIAPNRCHWAVPSCLRHVALLFKVDGVDRSTLCRCCAHVRHNQRQAALCLRWRRKCSKVRLLFMCIVCSVHIRLYE